MEKSPKETLKAIFSASNDCNCAGILCCNCSLYLSKEIDSTRCLNNLILSMLADAKKENKE